MAIREYTKGDKQQIVKLMSEFGDYLELIDPMNRTTYAPNSALYFTEKLIQETQSRQGKIFVAEDNRKIMGFIGGYVSKQSEEECMEAKKAVPGVISEFFVTQSSRKSGIGSQLLKYMEKYLRDLGCTIVRISVFAPNNIARGFYQKNGYQDRLVVVSKDL